MKNLKTTKKTREFKDYLEHFPQSNREVFHNLPFWPSIVLNQNEDGGNILDARETTTNSSITTNTDGNRIRSASVNLIIVTMPNPE